MQELTEKLGSPKVPTDGATPTDVPWLMGLSEKTLRHYGVQKVGSRVYFPCKVNGKTLNALWVESERKSAASWADPESPRAPFGADTLNSKYSLIITFDWVMAMRVYEATGKATIGLQQPKDILPLLDSLKSIESVVVLFNDRHADKAESLLQLCRPTPLKFGSLPSKLTDSSIKQALYGAKAPTSGLVVPLDEFKDRVFDYYFSKEKNIGRPSGVDAFDALVGGHRPGIGILIAETGVGKSSLMRSLISQGMLHESNKILAITLEDDVEATALRLIQPTIGIPLLGQEPEEKLRDPIEKRVEELHKAVIIVSQFDDFAVETVVSAIRKAVTFHGINTVCIDHLTLLAESSGENPTAYIQQLMGELRLLVQQTGVSIVAISHLSNGANGALSIIHMKHSGALRQVANWILGLAKTDWENITELRLLKDRQNGKTGKRFMLYDPDTDLMVMTADPQLETFNETKLSPSIEELQSAEETL